MKFNLKGNFFSGAFHKATSQSAKHNIERFCPSDTNLLLSECPVDYDHIEPTIESSAAGFKAWRKKTLEERIQYLRRYQEILVTKKDQIAEAIAWEVGKPLWEAKTEAGALIAKVDVTINEGLKKIETKIIENIMPNTQGEIYYKPIGPTFIIGPFNFPCHLANTQIVNALLAGNSVIFKPSEKTCYSGQLLAECFLEAGLPSGVFNLIQGGGELASRIVEHKKVRAIFFTGSKEVGQKILIQASKDLSKLVALELGGKNPTIIHKDAPIELAFEELIKASFLTSGQRCTSTSLVFIHRSLQQEFISKFHDISKRLIVDHAILAKETPFMGPLVDQKSLDSYLLFMGMAKREGIQEVMRGKQLEKEKPGYYVSPSIHFSEKYLDNSLFLASEIFGPNCTFVPYDEIEEAISMSNKTEYGLAASVFTKDKNIFQECFEEIDSGLINLNRSTCGASSRLPFGGVKNSGNHRPAAISTIEACVYPVSCLKLNDYSAAGLDKMPGIEKA